MTQVKIDGAGKKIYPEDEIAAERAASDERDYLDSDAASGSVSRDSSDPADLESAKGAMPPDDESPEIDSRSSEQGAHRIHVPDAPPPVAGGLRSEELGSLRFSGIPNRADTVGAADGTGTEPTSQPTTRSVSADISNEVLVANVGDQPTLVDTLGFTPYVEAIASFLLNDVTEPPLTLSIEGEWGSGKSSFMLQLEEKLRASDEATVVRFNAWRHDKDDAMWAAFAMEFTRKLSHELTWLHRWTAHIKLFFQRFDWERGWKDVARLLLMLIGLLLILLLPILMWDRLFAFVSASDSAGKSLGTAVSRIVRGGGIIGYLGLITLLFLKVKDVIGNPLAINLKQHLDTPDYRSRVAFIERFHQDFARVVDVYGKKKKVCVFIDDLDRCEVPKAADLMQSLNLMISDNSRLIFIMGMDREKVAAGLAVKYEKLLPYLAPAVNAKGAREPASFDPVAGLEYGYGFIEKFIQLPFSVPQASEDQMKEFLGRVFGQSKGHPPARRSSQPPKRTPGGKDAEKAVTQDSEMVSDILKMIAPTFEFNPRRMKQFINAFRLKTFIASRTGLFETPANTAKYDSLTVYQLGKFVAICLHWPLLLADLDNERDLLSRLQKLALADIEPELVASNRKITVQLRLAESHEDVTVTGAVVRWYQRKNLREFLRSRLFTADGVLVDDDTRRKYSLEKLDVNKLLQVSPVTKPVVREQSTGQSAATSALNGNGSNSDNQTTTRADTSATYPKVYGVK